MSLKKLVDQAVGVELELRRLHSCDGNLTAAAFLKSCAGLEGCTAKEAQAVEKALQTHEADLLGPSYRRMLKAIRELKRTGPVPVRLLAAYMDGEGDASLARLGATRASLYFAAARESTKDPSLFGTLTEPGALDRDVKKCVAKRVELLAAIEQGFVAGDILLDRDRATFRMAPSVAVAKNFAEGLVNWAIAERDQAEAA